MAKEVKKGHAEFDAIMNNHRNDGSDPQDSHAVHVGPGMQHKTRLADAPEQPVRKPSYDKAQKARHLNAGGGAADGGVLHPSHERTRLPDAPELDADIMDSNPV